MPTSPRVVLFVRALALCVLCFCLMAGASPAQEQPPQQDQSPQEEHGATQRFQLQIGSAKDYEGTKWYASKASRVLGEGTYVVQGGEYYIVLTGYYETREQAQARLMEVRQHYNGMVVSYELEDILIGYENGIPMNEEQILSLLTAGERKREARDKLRETQPIRDVRHDEASGLRKTVGEGLRNVRVQGCTLSISEELAGYDFRTTVALADLDPYSLQTREKHGEHLYFVLEARGGLSKVVTEQLAGGKVSFTRKDSAISLKPVNQNEEAVERLGTALQELITFCGK